MIFEYEELKECVEEDLERFYKMGFNEKQIFPPCHRRLKWEIKNADIFIRIKQ